MLETFVDSVWEKFDQENDGTLDLKKSKLFIKALLKELELKLNVAEMQTILKELTYEFGIHK